MSKLVLCDLDNTLLTKNKRITLISLLSIKKFVRKGNYFVIASGRPLSGTIKFYRWLGLKMPLVCDNGASIYFPDGKGFFILKSEYIPHDVMMKIFDEAKEYIIAASDTHNHYIYVQNKAEVPSFIIHRWKNSKIIEGNMIDVFEGDGVLPSLRVKPENKDDMIKILDKYKDYVSYRYWGDFTSQLGNIHSSFELFSNKASKGLSLLYLEKVLEIPHEETYGFGDQYNDLSLIKLAHTGVAMINASDKLKEHAVNFTDYDYNHNGVVKYMRKNKLF